MRTLKILSIVSISGMLILAFFSWYSCDDYCNLFQLSGNSIFKIAWFQYMHWDGRSLSIAGFVQLFSLKYLPVEMITLIWTISFLCTSIFIFKIIRLENSLFFKKGSPLIAVAILNSVMWLGMWKLIPDVIYWPTGGSYSLLNLLGLCWLFIFLSGLKSKRFQPGRCVFIFFISFMFGLNSHNLIIALIVLCLLEFIQYFLVFKNKPAAVYIGFAFAGLITAAVIVIFSPGNFIRLHAGGSDGITSQFLFNFLLVFARYIYWLLALFILCLLILWLHIEKPFFRRLNFNNRINEFRASFKNRKTAFEKIYRHKYLIAAMSTIVVFSVSSYFAVPRTAIFFGTFIIIYFFQVGWKDVSVANSKKFIVGSSLFLILFSGVVFYQVIKASSLKKQLTEREQIFKKKKESDVTVSTIPLNRVPFAFTFTDVSPDTGYWVNRCVAQYYELKTIRSVKKE